MIRSLALLLVTAIGVWLFIATTTADPVAAQADADQPTAEAAQDSLVSEQTLFDFRRLLMVGFSMVFLLMVGYLVLSHRKNATLAEDLAFLRKRIDSLESR